MPRAAGAALALATAAILASCGAHRPAADPGPRGTLRFACTPDDAAVEVDETVLGPAAMFSERGLLLKPGIHRVVLRAGDHFPEYLQVEISEGEVEVIEVSLRPVPE